MRFWIGGPRIGWFRPGVSFSAQELGFVAKPNRAGFEELGGSFVYVIRGQHGLCKIGVSTNPNVRLATLRGMSGFPLSFAFIGATNGTNGFAIEKEAHRVLDAHRAEGEWFDIPEELAIATVWAAAASIGEKLAFVDPSRVDEIIKFCTAGYGTVAASQVVGNSITDRDYRGAGANSISYGYSYGVGSNGIGGWAKSSRRWFRLAPRPLILRIFGAALMFLPVIFIGALIWLGLHAH